MRKKKTSRDYFYAAHRNLAGAILEGMKIVADLTNEEFEKLCKRRPHVWERYRKFFERRAEINAQTTEEHTQ